MRWLWHPTRLVLIVAVVVTAAVPALRREVVWQMRALGAAVPRWADSEYAEALGGGTAPGIMPNDWEAVIDAYPRDLQLRIALARQGGWPPPRPIYNHVLSDAMRLAPEDPVVLSLAALHALRANSFSFDRDEQYGGRRAERLKKLPSDWKPEALTRAQIAPTVERLDAWAKADPDNAAPEVFAAYLLVGANNDREALARLESAAARRYFTLYDLDIRRALAHVERLRGVPAPDAALTAAVGFDPAIELGAKLRNFARIIQAIGWDHFDDGDRATAFRYWLGLAAVGKRMAEHERETLIPRLVGMAIEAIGYAPIYRWTKLPKGEGKFAGGDFLPQEAYATFVAARGEQAARQAYEDLSSVQSLREEMAAMLPASGRFLRPYQYYLPARYLALLALPAALLTLLLWLAAVSLSPSPGGGVSALATALLILITIGVPMAVATAPTIMTMVQLLSDDGSKIDEFVYAVPRSPWPALALALGGPLLLAICSAVAGGLGAMRRTLPAALAVLAVTWVAATTVAVREGAIFSARISHQWHVGELRALQELGTTK